MHQRPPPWLGINSITSLLHLGHHSLSVFPLFFFLHSIMVTLGGRPCWSCFISNQQDFLFCLFPEDEEIRPQRATVFAAGRPNRCNHANGAKIPVTGSSITGRKAPQMMPVITYTAPLHSSGLRTAIRYLKIITIKTSD